MKLRGIVVMCLALLLVGASSNAFAAVLWETGGTNTWYVNQGSAASFNRPSQWYTSDINVLSTQGNTGPLRLELDISVKGNWNVVNTPTFQLFLVGGANTNVPLSLVAHPNIINNGPESHLASPLVTEVSLNHLGVYSFYAYAFGMSNDAEWKLNGAKLVNDAKTPIPGAVILLGSGLLGLLGVNKVRRSKGGLTA